MDKHTPGPWYSEQKHSDMLQIFSDETGEPVALVQGHYVQDEALLANSLLIAAAPDLLAALQAMVKWYGQRDIDNALLPPEDQEKEVEAAMTAIAKATEKDPGA